MSTMGLIGEVTEGRTAQRRAMLDTNVLGVACACRAALRVMLRRARGDIVIRPREACAAPGGHDASRVVGACSSSRQRPSQRR